MKKLVVFYSFEGNTKLMAETIAKEIDADVLEIKPEKEMKSRGFMKFFWGGKSVMTKEEPKLLPLDKNVEDYDLIFIGTPVWAWSYAPAFKSFFSNNKITDKKIALFCCHGGGKGKIFEKMKEQLENNEILGEIDFRDPLKRNSTEDIENVKIWAKDIIGKIYTK